MAIIHIEGMHFYAYHGCFKEEQVVGTDFSVDILLTIDTSVAQQSDNLADTIDYQTIYQIVKREMMIKAKLIEHLAHRILSAVTAQYIAITFGQVAIRKLNPPLGGKMDAVNIIITTDDLPKPS